MTKPYGRLLKWEFASYKKPDGRELKILLVRSAVAKRLKSKREPEPSPQENVVQQTLKVPMKVVPIVCDPQAEPWCKDTLQWISARKAGEDALRFDCTEMTVQNIVKRNLAGMREIDPRIRKVHPHFLRHCRITHLIKAYDFTPYQITAFAGWSMESTFQQMGVQASSNIDIYSHLEWKDYIDKLLVPLSEII